MCPLEKLPHVGHGSTCILYDRNSHANNRVTVAVVAVFDSATVACRDPDVSLEIIV